MCSFYSHCDQIPGTNNLKEEGFIWVHGFTGLVAWPRVFGQNSMEMVLSRGRRHTAHEGQEAE